MNAAANSVFESSPLNLTALSALFLSQSLSREDGDKVAKPDNQTGARQSNENLCYLHKNESSGGFQSSTASVL